MPPIEIRWGGGKWPDAPKRRLRPYVQNAVDMAQLCLGEGLGVTSDIPKQVHVYCIGNNDDTGGSTDSAAEFELYVPHRFIRHPRATGRLALPLFLHAGHELTHTYRYELGFPFSLLERVAGEGVSLWAERLIADQVLTDDERRRLMPQEFESPVSARDRLLLLDALLEDHTYLQIFEHETGFEAPDVEVVHAGWMDAEPVHGYAPWGYILGSVIVGDLLKEGMEFRDILAMPAEDMMGCALAR